MQTLANKQDASTAVTHTASTAVGSATQPCYINSSGVATACTAYNSASVSSATTATKLGSSTVGSSTQPIYLSGGSPTSCSISSYGASLKY